MHFLCVQDYKGKKLKRAKSVFLEGQLELFFREKQSQYLEVLGIEPRASYMQSMRSTTELHPLTGYLFANTFLETNLIS